MNRRTFLGAAAAAFALPRLPVRGAHPHAALFLYTRPRFRPRHAAIVQQALQQRHEAHTSGWLRGRDGRPVLAVGPVNSNVGFWHGDQLVKDIRRTWPFVAVLEYDGGGKPEAVIDWFRRARDSRSPDGWLLDPGVGYEQHIDAEMVTAQDDRWCYLAVPDTPTDSHVGDSEFVIRARVRWADGSRAQLGWWIWFEAPAGRSVDDWWVEQTALVDWQVAKSTRELGATAVAPVQNADRELAVWGTDTVFRFPEVPPDMKKGRGRG
jgi:hypothetical protein